MLGWRVAISVVLIPLLIGIFVLDHKAGASAPYLLALCCLLAMRGTAELVALLRVRSFQPSYPLTMLGNLGIVAAAWWGQLQPPLRSLEATMLAFAMVVLAIFLKACLTYRVPGKNLETLTSEILCVTYVGVLLAVTAQLRWMNGSEFGYLALASVVVATKCGDIGAYALGRLFGRRKLVPLLSPGKTWMGALGAVLGAASGSWAWLHFGPRLFSPDALPCSSGWSLAYGAILGVVGLIGDLAESLIKRDVGAKDAASLLPGFGGLLDLLDSILYAGPVALLLWHVMPLTQ